MDNYKHTVLIVDDVPDNITVLVASLQEHYRIKIAVNGEDALEVIGSDNPPDIILLDIMMAGMNGYEVCKRIKSDIRYRSIPVIFVTAKSTEEDEAYGLSIGAVDFIRKPFNPSVTLARINTQLALHDQNSALERQVKERTRVLYETRLEIVNRLGIAAEYNDNETGTHIIRMSKYCQILSRLYGLNEEESDTMLNASPMHDIGKIGIPDTILRKPDKLDTYEWEIMKRHTTIGAHILGTHDFELLRTAKSIILTHHERWDGEGYPNGLSKDFIPLEGRIAALADVFDALTSVRPYKEAWPLDKAFDYIEEHRGRRFDPALVDIMLKNRGLFISVHEAHGPH